MCYTLQPCVDKSGPHMLEILFICLQFPPLRLLTVLFVARQSQGLKCGVSLAVFCASDQVSIIETFEVSRAQRGQVKAPSTLNPEPAFLDSLLYSVTRAEYDVNVSTRPVSLQTLPGLSECECQKTLNPPMIRSAARSPPAFASCLF